MKNTCLLVALLFLGQLVLAQCTASFTWDDTDITIQFMDTSTSDPGDPIVSWSWDFDDNGNTSNLQNPIYTFSDADKYDVRLSITTQNGCNSSIEIEIETCVLAVSSSVGSCDANGNIPVSITINDPWDVADEVDVILDGQSVPGSPFMIDAASPVNITVDVPGDGLSHVIQCQSVDIATCGKTVNFMVPDCNSNCFLSGLQTEYPVGTIHTVDVGDDFFSPISTGMVLGDLVRFNWIGDGHSTTSDATSGPDAWNSGVISIGSTFDVSIQNPGTHPYYCIPHGSTGGVGMSGDILANCPSGNMLDIEVSFNTSVADPQGYHVYYDAALVPGSPFNYSGTGQQMVTLSITGDGNPHPLMIEDVADPTCTLTSTYNAPDCGQGGGNPTCSLTLTLGAPSGCDANQNVMIDATVSVANGGSSFSLSIDGSTPTSYNYTGPSTTVALTLAGDGASHTIDIVDDADPSCTATTSITTPNCNLPCNITNLAATAAGAGGGGGTIHTVNVEDFIFNPSIVNITVGDQVEWLWTGAVPHTATSDATSGPDSWDSGLVGNGSTFTSPVLTEGSHPYYCVPHGAPGGVGMAGTIFVLPPCNANGEVMVTVSFDIVSNGTNGFEILVDGQSAGTFSYVGGAAQSATVNVPGDNMSHTIEVRDVSDPSCTATTSLTTPDCNGGGTPVCMVDVMATVAGGCDANMDVPVDLTITASNQGGNFSVDVDGVAVGTFPYTGSTTTITIPVTGDGASHTIDIVDDADPSCTATTSITTPNCNLPCNITNLAATAAGAGGGGGTIHTVNVEDFIFNPSIVNITVGDQVEWVWTGAVPHTATSDATSGPDSWDSGLVGNGSTFTSPVLTEGSHPYYCVPHGAPGGVGMAGTIFVLPPCNANGEVMVTVSFDIVSNGTNGFEILVDGQSAGTFSYVGGAAQSATVNVPGDNMSHTIEVRDVSDPSCTATTSLTTPDCNGGGTPVCMVDVMATVAGGCDANMDVPVDLTITASNQGGNFSVDVDGVAVGTFPYTGSTTTITIPVTGDGTSHTIDIVDDADPSCTATTSITTPNCNLPCNITNLAATAAGAGGGGGTIHTVNVEDFIFNPSIVNITVGDQVEWLWTGAVPHTATSDATSGPDSWDSGLVGNGSTFTSPVLTEGSHPYYCVPHGAPGGVGMAGTIFVLPPCNANGEVMVTVSFDIVSNGTNGFEILVDGQSAGTFSYVGGAAQSATVNVPGDNMSHTIEVRDVSDPSCTATTSLTTPDCNGGGTPVCMVDVMATVAGGCDANMDVPVDLTITASNQGGNFSVDVDGVAVGTFPYTGSTTTITIPVTGDGTSHTIDIVDDADPSCTATTSITTPNCASGCSVQAIDISFGENITHIIRVEDFEFIPDSINVTLGDTLLFDWTGNIPHTATSDSPTGSDAFDSGLLSNGATYPFVPTRVGDHPYYCIPHGAPGGVGMAGNIHVSPACDGDQAVASISVRADGSSGLGFILTLDGIVLPESPLLFNPSGSSTTSIRVPGDAMDHTLIVADVSDPTCVDSITFTAPLCTVDTCQVEISSIDFGTCDGAIVEMTVDFSSLGPEEAHHVYLNGVKLTSAPIATDSQGMATYSTTVAGLGTAIEVVVNNILDNTCTDTMIITTPDCAIPCLMSDAGVGSSGVYEIEVRDFDFFPRDIQVLVGDTVRFVWTGVVPHTTTSDAISGMDSWDSGLFGEGHTYDVVVLTEGFHPYYCIPHGGPGGIGMAGSIAAVDTCDGDGWLTNYAFTVSAGSPLGYNIFIDGQPWNTSPIPYQDPTGINTGIISLPGDGMSHLVTFQDMETNFCAITAPVMSGSCGAGCAIDNLSANLGSDVIHEVEVRDFDFLPLEISVRVGETVRFIWTGDVPHTSTSDAITGPDSWESGLLTKGDTFDVIIQTPGAHPYYCIPHGGPGGIGQSGVIHALPACEEGLQEVGIAFEADGGSMQGYKLYIDGDIIGGLRTYDDPNGRNQVSILLPADGLQHIVTIQDDDNPICAASAFYTSTDCASDCEVGAITYSLVRRSHTVLVRDFDYLPLNLTVEAGDTIIFDWVGDIPHTVTSDAIEGPSSFNSGLLPKGEQWILILDEVGNHPYYCIPHGGPGGIGMAGNITVVDACEDGEVLAQMSFTSSRLSGTYTVSVNGSAVLDNQPYSGTPQNTFILSLPADGTMIDIVMLDDLISDCTTSLTIEGINCADPCFDVIADYDYNLNFATNEVDFLDRSTGNITAWSWDFGDGNSSNNSNPSHTYADPLVYEVCLTVQDDAGCMSTYCDKVRFSDEVCIAGFTYEQDDLILTFTNTSDYEDPDTEILWTFGDGSISNDISETSHTYDLGTYTVCLQISSDSCQTSYCEVLDLSDPCLLISPDFETVEGANDLTVQFNDLTNGAPDAWLWGFGDGNTSTEQNPEHTFTALGEYSICLFVQESSNSCSKSDCRKITVGTTGIVEVEAYQKLVVYPNPSMQNSTIVMEGFDANDIGNDAQISVWTIHGQQIYTDRLVLTKQQRLSFASDTGAYIIQVDAGSHRYRAMVLKQ